MDINELIQYQVRQFIHDNICKSYVHFFKNGFFFYGHHRLSLEQLKEIADILDVENIFIEHKMDNDYGDKETIIEIEVDQ